MERFKMKRYETGEVTDFLDPSPQRKGKADTSDGKNYCVKSARCKKCKCEDRVNPTYVANEVVYGFYARAAGLRIPEFCLIEYHGQHYFGSEVLPGRQPVNQQCQREIELLSELSIRPENFSQVVCGLLLDVALLNSDRHANNFLIENDTLVRFFDHDGALWGDGYPAEMKGDLKRVSLDVLNKEPHDKWFQDYLKSRTLNQNVWYAQTIADEVLRGVRPAGRVLDGRGGKRTASPVSTAATPPPGLPQPREPRKSDGRAGHRHRLCLSGCGRSGRWRPERRA